MEISTYLTLGFIAVGMVTDNPVLLAIPTALRAIANVAPSYFPLESPPSLLEKDVKKLTILEGYVDEIKRDLGLENMSVNLYVSHMVGENAFCLGNSSSLTGPVVGIGHTYFENFNSRELKRSSDYQRWQLILNSLSDEPLTLAKQLDNLPKGVRRDIFNLARKFKGVLTEKELKGVLAHELGHAKNNHLLKSGGYLGLIFALLTRIVPNHINLVGFLLLVKGMWTVMDGVSQHHEWEADLECQNASRYAEGLHLVTKKWLISSLVKGKAFSTYEGKVEEMLGSWDIGSSHPNHARRMRNALNMAANPKQTERSMSYTAKALSLIGGASLISKGALDAHNIARHFNYV